MPELTALILLILITLMVKHIFVLARLDELAYFLVLKSILIDKFLSPLFLLVHFTLEKQAVGQAILL